MIKPNMSKVWYVLALMGRGALIMPTLGAMVVWFVPVMIAYLWWGIIGWPLRLIFGQRIGGDLFARLLGCYPFSLVLVIELALVATLAWAISSRNTPWADLFASACSGCMDNLATYPKLRQIGGVW